MNNKDVYEQLIQEHGISALADFVSYSHERVIDTVRFQQTFGKLNALSKSQQDAESAKQALSIINKKIAYLVWENKFNAEYFFSHKLSFLSKSEQLDIIRRLLLRILADENIYDAEYNPDENSDDWNDSDYARKEKNEIAKRLLDEFSSLCNLLSDEESQERDRHI